MFGRPPKVHRVKFGGGRMTDVNEGDSPSNDNSQPSAADDSLDENLFAELRQALRPDPVPEVVHQYALASLGLRSLGLEIGTLLSDSFDGELAGVRSATMATRSLRFQLKEFQVDVQLEGHAIYGRVKPFAAGVGISVVTTPSCQFIDVDQFGDFRGQGVPSGPLRVELQLNGEAAATTEWILRPSM